MKAKVQLPSQAVAQVAVDILLDREVLARTAQTRPRGGTADEFFQQAAVDLLHALARAAASATDVTAMISRIQSWLVGDFAEAAELLAHSGDSSLASRLAGLQASPAATRQAVTLTAGDELDELLRFAANTLT